MIMSNEEDSEATIEMPLAKKRNESKQSELATEANA
ncbi:hypothetical protein A2U01_0109374, partial [Trifolium medium]|nr:hypothetical protein [Trifolium medium]